VDPEKIERIGRFRIIEPLGSGNARDLFLGEDDAGVRAVLKVLGAPDRNQGLMAPRVADEMSAYGSLSHPNLVKVLDLFSTEGQFVIALEHVEGASLSVARAALKRGGGALDDAAIMYVGASLFAALAAAHEAKDTSGKLAPVLHRNVNPSSVQLAWSGAVKLGNFDVASVSTSLRDSSPGFTWGSYGYSAPELVRQQPVGPAADVYSAAIVVWELLAGRKAIERGALTDAEVLTAMASPKLPSLDVLRPDADKRVRDALRVALEVDPARRLVTAAELRDALAATIDVDTERGRLVRTLEHVRPEVARPKAASKPHLSETPRVPPPRPAAKKNTMMGIGGPPSAPPIAPKPAPPAPAPPPPPPAMPRPPPPARDPAPPSSAPRLAAIIGSTVDALATTQLGEAPISLSPELAVSLPSESLPAPPPPPPPPPIFHRAPPEPPAPPPPRPPVDALAFEPLATAPSPGARRRAGLIALGVVLGGLIVVLVVVQLYVGKSRANAAAAGPASAHVASPAVALPPATTTTSSQSATTTVPPAPTAVAPAPSSAPSVTPAPATEPSSGGASGPAIPADRGELVFPPYAAGHRIFVDGRVVGDGAQPALVPCGSHSVRIGSAGTPQQVDVPCGQAITIGH
jgi:serine/threonine-protein kinase